MADTFFEIFANTMHVLYDSSSRKASDGNTAYEQASVQEASSLHVTDAEIDLEQSVLRMRKLLEDTQKMDQTLYDQGVHTGSYVRKYMPSYELSGTLESEASFDSSDYRESCEEIEEE